MAGFSSLIPRTSLKRAVSCATGNLMTTLSPIAAARNLFTGGGCEEIYGDRRMFSHSNLIRNHNTIGNPGVLLGPFQYLLRVNQKNKPAFLRVQSMSYQFVADSHVSPRRIVETEDEQDVSKLSKKESAGTPRKHQLGENIPKKDKIKFLVNNLLDMEDNKEVVYGALDAWVAWERNFPIASLKRVIAILEKEQQWHRMVQVIKWILSKGQGNTMGTYGQLIRALDKDRRAEEAHVIWRKKIGNDLHSVPWQLCLQMMRIYFRNNMLQELVKLFKDLESYDRKPPDKHIVQTVADAYELLGMLDEKERVVTKYCNVLVGAASDGTSTRSSRKKKKPELRNTEATTEDVIDAETAELQEELKVNVDTNQDSEGATDKDEA
ncbi:PREDICTED: pentatricopeptide repeat-containing protein At4g18975, chloroplastic [Camelina sativa]|uniref:Pentatricopeptide repeat-containing protein At4g18975, chloroplastic n=1 Tax=Camelina sativa TaxID=90675 RepID=A0ABM0WRH6_CAMSA|nr:PREDICTED: pentatricopeptide repeat-containing protein At4g18975, chloroplastic [Camelina sativa]